MNNITNIENFRKFIKDEHFRCVEIHDKAGDIIIFAFMTNEEKKTVHVVYNVRKDGSIVFDKAHIVTGNLEYSLDYLESMLMCAQCTYIKHYCGDRIVDFSRYDKPTKKTKSS